MRLLIAEGDEHIAPYLKATLESEGFEVDLIADGAAALTLALTGRYDAIMLDVVLPGMGGCEVCREIRQAGLDTPVFMTVSKNDRYNEADALSAGATDFLSKPFSFTVLVARVKALLLGETLSVAGIELYPAKRTVTRNGTLLELAPLEFSLLELLMRNQDRAVNKAEILEHVWGEAPEVSENTVEVYIGYLCKKVDAPFGRKSIITVRSLGYRIIDELA